ncbi:MAG: hypothetical protein OQJ84_06480 [Xanthomonadales bacterium]|nr:hypothetical protein [Xanthomonadales bacterium]
MKLTRIFLSLVLFVFVSTALAAKPEKDLVCHVGNELGSNGETYQQNPECDILPPYEGDPADYICPDAGKIDLIEVSKKANHLGNLSHAYDGISDYRPEFLSASGEGKEDSDGDGIDDGCEFPAQFILEVDSDLFQFDDPGFLSDDGSVGYGAGRLGDIADIKDPISGYKIRFWGANPPFTIGPGIPGYDPHDYNPGPASFGGDPNEVANFVIGIDNYAYLTFEDALLSWTRGIAAQADYAYGLAPSDGQYLVFPDLGDMQTLLGDGILYYYTDSNFLEMAGEGDTFFGPAKFALKVKDQPSVCPEVTYMGVVWSAYDGNGGFPAGGYHASLKAGTYDKDTDYNPFRTGQATLKPSGIKRINYSNATGPLSWSDGGIDNLEPNNMFITYQCIGE